MAWEGYLAAFLEDPEGVARVLGVKIEATLVRAKQTPSIQTELAWVIEIESKWNPAAQNPKSKATGLIQFMKGTAEELGTTLDALKGMSRGDQSVYVQKYFDKVHKIAIYVGDVYMMVAAPAYVGQPDGTVVYPVGSAAWKDNPGWRMPGDGPVTAGSIRRLGVPPTEMIPGLGGALSKPPGGKKPTPAGAGKPAGKPSTGSGWGAGLLALGLLFLMSKGKKSRRRR